MSKIDVIMRELDWSGKCPIPIKDQVRFALIEVDAKAREEEHEWIIQWLRSDQRHTAAFDVACAIRARGGGG